MGVNITPSIIQQEQVCYVSKRTDNLDPPHHVFGGNANRKLSEKYGIKIWLTRQAHDEWHNSRPNPQYITKEVKAQIKNDIQLKVMEHYGWTLEKFIKIFGESYLL